MIQEYKVILSTNAKNQIKGILHQITYILHSTDYTLKLRNKFYDSFSSLSHFPYRYQIVEDDYLKKLNIRKYTVDSYVVFYTVYEKRNTVYIVSVNSEKQGIDTLSKSIQYSLENLFGKDFFINEPTKDYNL